jgi:hypothetical protein
VQSGDDKITLAPGREVLLTDKSITPEDAIADDGIGRRRLAAYKLHNQKFAVVDDFAIVSLVNSARHLRPLREPITATDVQLREKMVKMAAAVEYTSMNRGRYTVRQKETACR